MGKYQSAQTKPAVEKKNPLVPFHARAEKVICLSDQAEDMQ